MGELKTGLESRGNKCKDREREEDGNRDERGSGRGLGRRHGRQRKGRITESKW